ncbi:MAG: polymer-forming cytoskeletal protein [Pseudomonadota bacterium]
MGRHKDTDQINGLIDRGCSVEGKLMFDGTVQINGDFHGEILSDGTLIVGPEAKLNARIQIDTIVVEGKIEGTIEAKQKIELRRGANLTGDILTPTLVVEQGAVFHGNSKMQTSASYEDRRGTAFIQDSSQYSEDEGGDSLMM